MTLVLQDDYRVSCAVYFARSILSNLLSSYQRRSFMAGGSHYQALYGAVT
jgi:hypothetical protein